MIASLVTSELVKVLLNRLATARPEDYARALRSIERATRKMPLLPGLAGFGIGVAVGTGLGVLLAPRSGKETRAAIYESIQNKIRAWRKAIFGESQAEEPTAEPVQPAGADQRPQSDGA